MLRSANSGAAIGQKSPNTFFATGRARLCADGMSMACPKVPRVAQAEKDGHFQGLEQNLCELAKPFLLNGWQWLYLPSGKLPHKTMEHHHF